MSVIAGTLSLFQLKANLCDKKEKTEMFRSIILMFGIPPQCPVANSTLFCYKGDKIVFSESTKRLMNLMMKLNNSKLRLTITHDTGKSCFESESSLIRKKKTEKEK